MSCNPVAVQSSIPSECTVFLNNAHITIRLSQIVYIKGDENYAWLHWKSGSPALSSRCLKSWQKETPNFWRIHKGYLVNPDFIDTSKVPSKKDPYIQLVTGLILPVARRRVVEIADKIKALS